ncbi:hypothetical protein, conserved [Plasmodium gonderi]|uniref:Uncharacterized protein n=1 Tax=Plasmodium gonderi TaxID=77519 RepID=A0A1Y1JH89_PLAGO|nr:hypothetical protein, conserved [Plasmodium gonderi]GAW79803.1 hypothetical protein, conserved [Plasmodium gonderi]
MKAPAFKPIYDVIRIKKREELNLDIDTKLYKDFLDAKKKNQVELNNTNVKIHIYEYVQCKGKNQMNSDSDSSYGSVSTIGEHRPFKEKKRETDEPSKTNKQEPKDEQHVRSKKGKGEKYESHEKGEKYGNDEKGEKYESDEKGGKYGNDEKGEKYESDEKGEEYGNDKIKIQGKERNHRVKKQNAGIATKDNVTNWTQKNDPSREEVIFQEESAKEGDSRVCEKGDVKNANSKSTNESQRYDMVKETKSFKMIGTVKILYNFYVNLFEKLKEDVENIQNNTSNSNVNLFRDVNLYTNYISMFDIINLCEDLKIIKTFLNSKKECELIWILTVNYFDRVNLNVFETYKHKIDVVYRKNFPVKERKEVNMNSVNLSANLKEATADSPSSTDPPISVNMMNAAENGNKRCRGKVNKCKEYTQEGEKKKNDTTEKLDKGDWKNETNGVMEESEEGRKIGGFGNVEEMYNIKEYIYENLHEKKNAIMFRKVNFFVFVYVLIYIIKTSSRKIKSITDDIKKVRSFFFFLNLYEKKKTIETLTNIYKDKYLTFYQNFKGRNEIEDYRKRKIFCHKFSFYNINKILNVKDDNDVGDLVRLKNICKRENKNSTTLKEDGKAQVFDQLDIDNKDETTVHPVNTSKDKVKPKEEEHNEDAICNYHATDFVQTSELTSDFNVMNKLSDENKKENSLLNQYIFDYIFKNYCYRKKYWKIREDTCINFGIVQKENKKYKVEIYNHTKYNISVDVHIDPDLPLLAIFKDKLFCISSKYTIYLQVDKTKQGEKFGFVNVIFRYKNVSKADDIIKIPVYLFVSP